jgi:hypothetical protein
MYKTITISERTRRLKVILGTMAACTWRDLGKAGKISDTIAGISVHVLIITLLKTKNERQSLTLQYGKKGGKILSPAETWRCERW